MIDALANTFDLIAQYSGSGPYDYGHSPHPEPETSPLQALSFLGLVMVFAIGIFLAMGWWGKSKAELHGVNPWIGFCLGAFGGLIGIFIIPHLGSSRSNIMPPRIPDRYMNAQQPYGNPPPPQQYAQANQFPQPPNAGPPQQYAPPPPNHPPMPGPQPPMGQAQHHAPPQPPVPQRPMTVKKDAAGFVQCPACGGRSKAGRRACMHCGEFLPPVEE